jgi:hypothetical protein
LRYRFLRFRLIRAASASLSLAALQVLAESGGKARSLLVFCGWWAVHGINSASTFQRSDRGEFAAHR